MSTRSNWHVLAVSIILTTLVVAFTLTVRLIAQDDPASWVEAIIGGKAELSKREEAPQARNEVPINEVADSNSYAFATGTAGTLTDMSTGTTQLLAGNIDDTASGAQNIGFDFYFMGARFTTFAINDNGVLRLGANSQTSTPYQPLAQASIPLITAYGADQRTHTGDGKVHYKVIGSAPNRTLVIEWLNMQSNFNSGGTADLTYQARINESTGVIEFVYGSMTMSTLGAADVNSNDPHIGYSSSNLANTVGSVAAPQAGAPTFNGTSNDPTENLYTAGPITVLTSATDGVRRTMSFTPPVPAAPTGLNFTGVTALSVTLNWTDSANEDLYGIYRSTDGTNYSFLTTAAENAVSHVDSTVLPGTTYFYRVFAVSEGALSTALSGSQATNPAGNDSCAGAGGLWNTPATWADNSVPTAADNVTIGTGCTVTIDSSNAFTITVQSGGVLQFEDTTARTLTVTDDVTIDSGGTIRSGVGGTQTGHVLSVGGDLINNGTIDFSTNTNTAAAGITFTTAGNAVFTLGGSSTTDLKQTGGVILNKGTNNTSVLSFSPGGTLTVLGANTAGFLTITNGTFKMDGSGAFSNPLFSVAAYPIPSTGGLWMNNANATVVGQNGSPTLTGRFQMTSGTYNIGTSTGNSMGFAAGANLLIEGGAINATGRFGVSASGNAITYNQNAGTITACTIGHASTTLACFDLGTGVGTTNITGGNIVIQVASTAASGPRDYRNQSGLTGTTTVTGGTVQFGNAASGAAQAYDAAGVFPNVVVDNTSAAHTVTLLAPAVFNNVTRNVLVNPGTTFNVGNNVFLFNGTTFTNNGTLTANGASSNFVIFLTGGAVSYTGTGGVTVPMTNLAVQADGGSFSIDPATSGINVNALRLFSGNIINANELTIGSGGTTTATVQIGNTTTPTNAGTFDSAPTFNPGTGGTVMSYLRTGGSRTTGPEVPASRSITTLTYDDNTAGRTLTIAGGDLTMTGAATALALTNGRVITGSNNLILSSGTAAVTRTTGLVDGNLTKTFAAVANKNFEVGTANGYSPVAVNVTAGTFPATFTAKAVQGAHPGFGTPSLALSRYWTLTEGGDVTADLTFNYLDPADIPVTATEASFVIFKHDGMFTMPGGSVNAAANTASITGVTSFSDWTLAEPGATATPGVLAFSAPTYSVGEAGPTATLTVNRTGGSDGAVNVNYSLGGGTATGGAACGGSVDYVNTGGTLMFAAGDTSETFNVPICNDSDVEADETFDATLSSPTGGATIGSPNPATVTITDNDTPSDPVTVTATAGTTGPTGYATLTAAVAAINAGTHQGDIVVNINQNTTEPAAIVINSSGAGPASYTSMIIRPTADGLTVAGPTVQGRGLIELNGADNVDINGDNPNSGGTNRNLTLQNTAANTVTFTSVVRIALAATVVTTANNNQIRNVNVVGSATGRNIPAATTTTGTENTTFGIFVGPGASAADATLPPVAVASVVTGVPAAATATALNISNNSVVTSARAVSVNAAAATNFPGLQISGNTIGNSVAGDPNQVTSVGITASGSADGSIRDNTVWVEGFVASSAAGHGIAVGVNGAFGTFTIERNKVNRVRNSHPGTFSAFGVNLGGSTNHVVQNNFISNISASQVAGTAAFSATFGSFGVRVGSGTGHKVYHNSVHLYGTIPGTTSTYLTAGLVIAATTQTGVDVRNNIFSNQLTGGNPTGARHAAIALPTSGTSAMNLTLNNNAYFVGSGPLNRLGQVGFAFGTGEFQAADFDPTSTTPATNMRAYTSTLSAAGTNDNASFATTAPPPFVSDSDLHIPVGTATRLESGGAAVGVMTDIDSEARNATTPDIGADEFAGNPAPANDIAASSFVTPANGSTIPTGAAFTPQARFVNNGTAVQTSVTVRFRIIDAGMTTIYNQTAIIATINPLQVVTVTFPSTSIALPGTYSMIASAELAGDSNTGNDSINGTFNAVNPVSGTVTVGTGGDFTSLTNPGGLFQQLNLAGISSDLTVNIISDLAGETGAVALNQLTEVGGPFTVTIKPSGAARTINGTGAASNGIINLHGADRIVIDGSLSGGTDRSLTITNSQTGLSTIIWIKSASAANGATNNTIKNLILTGTGSTTAQTTAGVLAGSGVTLGNAAEAPNNNNTVTNNQIFRVQNGLYNQGNAGLDQNWSVTNNEFGSTVEADKNRFRGMLMGNANNFVISGNQVLGVTNFTGTTGANTGIHLAFSITNGMVVNNRISNVHNLSATGTGAFGMQLGATPTTNIVIANNFIWDIQANGSATVTSNGHGITINGAATAGGYKIYHNSINLNTNQVVAGTSAALNITSAVVAAGALDVRNNIFANTQTTGTRFGVFSAAAAGVFGTINGNDYFAQNVGSLGGVRATLPEWQTATGQDANSLAVDPVFVSPTDLHLQLGSPMTNQGVSGTGITTDIDNEPRGVNPDIGADELQIVGNPGSLQFSNATYSVGEAGPVATITVTRTGGSDGTVSAQYASTNGSATGGASCTAGIDYVNTNGTVTFVAGDVSETFDVPICQDAGDEPDETVNLGLSNPTGGATIGSPSSAVLTILDDDLPAVGTLSINDVRLREGNSGSVLFQFTVTLTGSGGPVSVQYATTNGTAIAGVDYLSASGPLNFAGDGAQIINVKINSETLKEANETFFVNLSSPTGATIADNQGVGIIIDEDRAYVADYDRDFVTDVGVFRPSNGVWYIRESSSIDAIVTVFGISEDIIVPGDYDGDGIADYAVWRPSTGVWHRFLSADLSTVSTAWGASTDKPVQGDYDGDGKTDLGVFRPSTGQWFVLRSSNGQMQVANWGQAGDRLVQGDYDGDAITDFAVVRNGTWHIARSSGGTSSVLWGLGTDLPVSGDFDGDGKFDLAVYRNGVWWIFNSLTGTVTAPNWGNATDVPVPGDYDGDGTTDVAIFRPTTGEWLGIRSSNLSTFGLIWGINGDVPVPPAVIHPE